MPDQDIDGLVSAIRKRQADEVRTMLAASPGLVAEHHDGSFGGTALIHAVATGDRDLVDIVLEAGADIDQRSDWWAGSFGVLDHCSDEIGAYLLERGATLTPHAAARMGMTDQLRDLIATDPDCVRERGGDGQLPLHFARTAEIADLLLDAGAPLDERDIDHESTAAQWLAVSRPAVAAHLLERGAEADPFVAATTGRTDMLEDLAPGDPGGVDARVTRERFSTKGERAAEHIYFYTIGKGCTPLHAAAAVDRVDVVRWLCARGADTEARGGYDDSTPLHTAAWCDAPGAARALVEGGAEIDAPSGALHQNEPVGWAVVSGALETVNVLVELGARLRPEHLVDAEAGARGELRDLNRERPIEAWKEIRAVLAAAGA